MSQPGDKTDRLLSTKGTSRQRRKNRAKASSPRSSSPDISSEPMPKGHKYPALSSSVELEGIQIRPRTPRTALHSENGDAVDEVELSLLNEDERRAAAASDTDLPSSRTKAGVSTKDKRGMALLIVLYLIQGVPLGLALGSVPFLLREHLSYSQLGTFALAGYPYSLKLLWSPIVDSCYFPSVGRRKSWIVPMQFVIGSLMLWIANNVDVLLETPAENINKLTFIFTTLVLLFATQGTALVHSVSLSSQRTIQFVGINAFHTRISDPLIGGTYMTLLNTFSNLGGTWPRYFVFKGVDFFSVATCKIGEGGSETILEATECVSDLGKAHCADLGGTSHTERDGYYIVSAVCILLGIVILAGFVRPTARRLQALPVHKWRVSSTGM